MAKRVFVYGTLMSGEENHHILKDRSKLLGEGVISGTIYEMPGNYPALIEDEGIVRGELFEFEDEDVLKQLDRIEGYYGKGKKNLYDRERRDIIMADGKFIECWVYIYRNKETAKKKGAFIPGGNWKEYKQIKR